MGGSQTQGGATKGSGNNYSSASAPANLLRVLTACCYDGLLSLTFLFVATAVVLIFTQGQAIRSGDLLYDVFLLAVPFPYFAYSWMRGQTLGMRAWGLHIRNTDGALPTLRQCLVRYLAAVFSWLCFGLGFLWIGVDRRQLSWHDRLSGTRLLR